MLRCRPPHWDSGCTAAGACQCSRGNALRSRVTLLAPAESPTMDAYFFFFNDPATTEIYTLPLHDALPICDSFPVVLHLFELVCLARSLKRKSVSRFLFQLCFDPPVFPPAHYPCHTVSSFFVILCHTIPSLQDRRDICS